MIKHKNFLTSVKKNVSIKLNSKRLLINSRKKLAILGILLIFIGVFLSRLSRPREQYETVKTIPLDERVIKLKNFLSANNSPLSEYAPILVEEADKNGLDWRLIPAITGVESTYGHFVPSNSYNAYGWDAGRMYFSNWRESISVVSYALNNNYVKHGADSVEKIGFIYNPVTPVEWSNKVNSIMIQIGEYYPRSKETSQLNLDI